MKYNREELVGYDFQSWPIFKMNVKEILLKLGGTLENGKIVFDEDDPVMNAYPLLLEDDGMGYGIDEQYVTDVDKFKSDEDTEDIIYVNIFRTDVPSELEQQELFKRWDEDEAEVKASIENSKKILEKNREKL